VSLSCLCPSVLSFCSVSLSCLCPSVLCPCRVCVLLFCPSVPSLCSVSLSCLCPSVLSFCTVLLFCVLVVSMSFCSVLLLSFSFGTLSEAVLPHPPPLLISISDGPICACSYYLLIIMSAENWLNLNLQWNDRLCVCVCVCVCVPALFRPALLSSLRRKGALTAPVTTRAQGSYT
jgi:hypothetical protein